MPDWARGWFAVRAGRFELKYLIEESLAQRLSAQLDGPCRLDAEAGPTGGYTVTSLYLDSPDLVVHRAVLTAQPIRWKARIRSYGAQCAGPHWVEVKRRYGEVIVKTRTKVAPNLWPQLVERDTGVDLDTWPLGPKGKEDVGEFRALCQMHDLEPRLNIRYDREPWVGVLDPDLRVTFDRSLRYAASTECVISADESRYRSFDFTESMIGTQRAVVLEIKFGAAMPGWLAALVRTLQLQRGSFAKYSKGLQCDLDDATAYVPGQMASRWS